MVRSIAPLVLAMAASTVACSVLSGETTESTEDGLSIAGRWKLPPAVAEAGATMVLEYDGAPNWSSRRCAGRLKSGAMRLGTFLEEKFPAITSVGGYACRRNTADARKMSVHGTGRALDIFIPTVRGLADNTKGDAVANYLVMNADRIGVQLIIWDRTVWMANGRNDKMYGGPVPHVDHLHVEITEAAAARQTPWFQELDGGAASDFDDDAGTDAIEEEADAGAAPDAAAEPDAHVDPEPDPDEPSSEPDPDPPAPPANPPSTTDAGAPAPVQAAPTNGDDSTTSTANEPLPEDEPAEGESTGTPRRKRTTSAAQGDEAAAASGCSAAPARSREAAVVGPLALVIAASLVRRRRRD